MREDASSRAGLPAYLRSLRQSAVVRRFVGMFGVDVLVKASSALLLPLYLRVMTQDEFGLYSYLVGAITTACIVLNFGLYVPQTKLIAECADDEERGAILFTINLIVAGALAVVLGCTFGLGLDQRLMSLVVHRPFDYAPYRPWLLLTLVVNVVGFMLWNYLLATEQVRRVQVYNVLRLVLGHGLVLALLSTLHGDSVLTRLKFVAIIELVLVALFGVGMLRSMRPKFVSATAMRALHLAYPVMLSAILGIAINFSDKYFLERYGTLAELSIYYLALTISSVIPLAIGSFQSIWLPLFLKEPDQEVNAARTRKLVRVLFGVFTAASLGLLLLLKVALWIGIIDARYDAVLTVLPIVLLTQLATALIPMYTNYLVYLEKTHVVFGAGLVVGVVSIGANLVLTPRFTMYGAAASALVCALTYLLLYQRLLARWLGRKGPLSTPRSEP